MDSLPDGLALPKQRDVVKALLGPVASAAVASIADHADAFFGRAFEDDEPLGALTKVFLVKVAQIGLGQTFTKTGAVELYRSALTLAASRPEVFLGSPSDSAEKVLSALFANLAKALEEFSPPFDHQTVTELMASALEAVGASRTLWLDPNKSWDHVLDQALSPILSALAQAVRTSDTGALKRLMSGKGVKDFVRIILMQVSKTPGMPISDDNEEVMGIVAAVAGAMAKDEQLLLSEDDWLLILAVAAEEAAANPSRLFGLKASTTTTEVAAPLMEGLLLVAATQWKQLGRANGNVLFGATLREAAIVTLRAAAGNAKAALDNVDKIKRLAETINSIVTAAPERYGSKEWLRLYRVVIARILQSGKLDDLDTASVEAILMGGS